jgi:hypothetical protein
MATGLALGKALRDRAGDAVGIFEGVVSFRFHFARLSVAARVVGCTYLSNLR